MRRLNLAAFVAVICLLSSCALPPWALSVLDSLNRPVAGQQVACPQWLGAARLAGFTEAELPHLMSLMHRESRCDPGAFQVKRNRDGIPDRGLLQIHGTWLPTLCGLGIACAGADLFNPQTNLHAARLLFELDGFGP